MSGSPTDSLIGGGVALVTIGSVLMGVGGAQTVGSHQSAWHDSWFVGGCAFVAVGAALVIGAIISRFRHRVEAPAQDEDEAPLRLSLINEDWILVLDTVWVFGLEICFTNFSVRAITLIETHVELHPGGRRGPIAAAVVAGMKEDETRLRDKYGNSMFNAPLVVPVDGRVARSVIASSYVPIPDGGRPRCVVVARDSVDNTYELEILARPSRSYPSREK